MRTGSRSSRLKAWRWWSPGSVTVYAPHGAYQLQVKKMEKAGLGEKYLLVEQWKKELAAEGLFCRREETPAPLLSRTDRRRDLRDRRGDP